MSPKNYSRYNSSDGVIEIIIRNSSGGKEEVLKANHKDKKAHSSIGNILKNKWDIDLTPKESAENLFDY